MRTLLSLLTVVVLLLTVAHSPAFTQAHDSVPPTKDPGWELGHTRAVSDLAYSWDGKLIASTGEDGSVRLWNAADGALVKTLLGDAKQGLAVRFAPDGQSLASCGRDKQIRVWSLPEGGLIHTLSGHNTLVRALAWSPAGTLLASGGEDGQVVLWNLASGDHQVLHTPMPVVDTLVFSPDGKTLTVDSEKESDLPNENAPRRRRYGEKGTHLIALYDVETGQPRQNWLTQSGFADMTFSPEGSLIAIYAPNPKSTLGETTIRDSSTGRVLKTLLSATTNRPPHIIFSSDQKTFLASDAQATVGGEIGQVWDLTQATPKSAKFAVDFNVRTISPDGNSLTGQDAWHYNRVVVYDSLTWRERWASADPSLILGSKPTPALLKQLSEDYLA